MASSSVLLFTHRIGDDATLTIPVRDSSGTAVDCSAGTRTCDCRSYPGNTTSAFDESSTGVTLAGTTTGMTIAFTEAALSGVNAGTYFLTLAHTTAGGATTTYSYILLLLPKGY